MAALVGALQWQHSFAPKCGLLHLQSQSQVSITISGFQGLFLPNNENCLKLLYDRNDCVRKIELGKECIEFHTAISHRVVM